MAGGGPQDGSAKPVILTPGDPAGIGAEISLTAFAAGQRGFILMEDPDRLAAIASRLGLNIPLDIIDDELRPMEATAALPVLPLTWETPPVAGTGDARNAATVIESIRLAVALTRKNRAGAVVTNPINKAVLMEAGFTHPGHTEFLASMAPPRDGAPMMMLASKMLRVVPATVHIPLREVPNTVTTGSLVSTGRLLGESLTRYFGVSNPRIAFCGLNPHAGENGQFGDEDQRIIAPAVDQLQSEGIAATGPLSADTLFHQTARQTYDAVIGMYHDQVLIPLKTLDFDGGVNVTLGLDFIRTSPDHGTAFDIAGTGRARPDSLMAAIEMAQMMAAMDARTGASHQHGSR